MLIGSRLRLARVEAGKTLRQTEKETGLSKDTISRIERGTREPQPLTVAKLAKAYGWTAEEFLEGPKAHRSSPEAHDASEGERLLEKLIRRVIADLKADADRWEALGGAVSLDVYRELVARRISLQSSLSTLDDVSKALDVNISDRRGNPLRRVRRELQSAFNRWNAARSTLIDRHFDAVMERWAEQEEVDVESAEGSARPVTNLALYREEKSEEKSAGERMASQVINDVG